MPTRNLRLRRFLPSISEPHGCAEGWAEGNGSAEARHRNWEWDGELGVEEQGFKSRFTLFRIGIQERKKGEKKLFQCLAPTLLQASSASRSRDWLLFSRLLFP